MKKQLGLLIALAPFVVFATQQGNTKTKVPANVKMATPVLKANQTIVQPTQSTQQVVPVKQNPVTNTQQQKQAAPKKEN